MERLGLKAFLTEEFDFEKPTEAGVRMGVIDYLEKYNFGNDRYDFNELIKAAYVSQDITLFELIFLLSLQTIETEMVSIKDEVEKWRRGLE